MAKTLAGLVYDTRTLALRRIIIADDDSHLGTIHKAGQFEAMIHHPLNKGLHWSTISDSIRLHSGREPPTLDQIHALGL